MILFGSDLISRSLEISMMELRDNRRADRDLGPQTCLLINLKPVFAFDACLCVCVCLKWDDEQREFQSEINLLVLHIVAD